MLNIANSLICVYACVWCGVCVEGCVGLTHFDLVPYITLDQKAHTGIALEREREREREGKTKTNQKDNATTTTG